MDCHWTVEQCIILKKIEFVSFYWKLKYDEQIKLIYRVRPVCLNQWAKMVLVSSLTHWVADLVETNQFNRHTTEKKEQTTNGFFKSFL